MINGMDFWQFIYCHSAVAKATLDRISNQHSIKSVRRKWVQSNLGNIFQKNRATG